MSQPADDQTTRLRERLDQLADSVSAGNSIDGAQLYRQGVRRRRRRIAAAAGLAAAAVVIVGAAIGSAVQSESSSPEPPAPAASDPVSPAPSDGCVLTHQLAHGVELGAVTEEQACQLAEAGEQENEARQEPQNGGVFAIEGKVQEDMVADCRAGTSDFGETAEDIDLNCNAILKIAAGELKPTRICDPPECSEPGTPLWEYSEAELRDLADANR